MCSMRSVSQEDTPAGEEIGDKRVSCNIEAKSVTEQLADALRALLRLEDGHYYPCSLVGQAHSALAAYEASKATPAHELTGVSWRKLHSDLLSLTDNSNWDIDEIKGTYFQGYSAAMEILHDWLHDNWPAPAQGQGIAGPAHHALDKSAAIMSEELVKRPTVDELVKQAALDILIRITCVQCVNKLEAKRPAIEQAILNTFFRCGDARAESLIRERDEARRALEKITQTSDRWQVLEIASAALRASNSTRKDDPDVTS